jgi:hypothetical protein
MVRALADSRTPRIRAHIPTDPASSSPALLLPRADRVHRAYGLSHARSVGNRDRGRGLHPTSRSTSTLGEGSRRHGRLVPSHCGRNSPKSFRNVSEYLREFLEDARHARQLCRMPAGRGALEQAPPRLCDRATADARQRCTRVSVHGRARVGAYRRASRGADLWPLGRGASPLGGSGVSQRAVFGMASPDGAPRRTQSNNDESAEHERLAAPLEVHHGRIVRTISRTISPGSPGKFGGWVLKLESATYGLVSLGSIIRATMAQRSPSSALRLSKSLTYIASHILARRALMRAD